MSRISDVSGKLGQYMLAGWILTDEGCGVCSIPMLRSPIGQSPERLLCVQCQPSPEEAAPRVAHHGPPPLSTASASSASLSHVSRVSTPPTEVSSTLSSPTFAVPLDPQEIMRRRAQSDQASAEIGRRMLLGWALLAEECPTVSCYGVPLVRPPKAGGERDPRKECVICGKIYVFEKDSQGLHRLVPLNSTSSIHQSNQSHRNTSNPEPARAIPAMIPHNPQPTVLNANNQDPTNASNASEPPPSLPSRRVTSSVAALDASVTSLGHALLVLADRLTAISSGEPVNVVFIGDIASSMEKVGNALRVMRQLRIQESSLHAS